MKPKKTAQEKLDSVAEIFRANAATNAVNESELRALLALIEAVAAAAGVSRVTTHLGTQKIRDAYYALRDEKLQDFLIQIEKVDPAFAAQVQKLIDERPKP